MMILSWALVEVPRYAFYVSAIATGDATKKTPFPLFWLRYSLFAVLYPTGITGEILVFLASRSDDTFLFQFSNGSDDSSFSPTLLKFFIRLILIIYAFGALPMVANMASNRKKAMKKRFAKAPPPPRGLVWPEDGKGGRSSTPVAKLILAAAVGASSKDKADAVTKERKWRFGYIKHFVGMVEEQMRSSSTALKVAEAGLTKAYESFEFIRSDGSKCTFGKAMTESSKDIFLTGIVKGEGQSASHILEVPYKGTNLTGQALKNQVDAWVSYGTIEASAGEAIKACVDNPQKNLDLSGRYFVLLGAGSAMGPFLVLMALGANVIAVDLDRPGIWKRLISIAQKSSGTLTFPMSKKQSECKDLDEICGAAGCNLFTQTPAIRDWLLELYPGSPLVVGSYAYLDGALHVQVSLAMDAICRDLSEKRKASLAYLCTPTDLHVITEEAHKASLVEYEAYSRRPFCMFMRFFSKNFLKKNAINPIASDDGSHTHHVVDGLSVAQGPNYALAKRMQHWRAIVARNQGSIVSSNVAPATSTASVVHNRTFAWAYGGMPYFSPYEIFEPATSNAVMSAILLADLVDPSRASNPSTSLGNPNDLFQEGSFNGGTWRCAYKVDSIGEASVLIHFAKEYGKVATTILVAAGAVIAANTFNYI